MTSVLPSSRTIDMHTCCGPDAAVPRVRELPFRRTRCLCSCAVFANTGKLLPASAPPPREDGLLYKSTVVERGYRRSR